MPADGICIGIGSWLSDSAKAYFKKHGKLPPRDLGIDDVSVASGPASLESLLVAIKASRKLSFLLYAHGFSDGSGLYLKLSTRRGAAVGNQTTFDVIDSVIAAADTTKPVTDRKLQFLGITKEELERLVGLMTDVQGKNIEKIEFRGCNLGRSSSSMASFKKFFGAASFGAPDFYSFFGRSSVQIGQTWVDNNTQNLPAGQGDWHTYTYTFDSPSGILLSNIATDDALKPAAGLIVADSLNTVQRWVKKFVDPDGTFDRRETSILLHGMWDTGKRKISISSDTPLDADLKLPDPAMILPFGSDDYKTHIIYV